MFKVLKVSDILQFSIFLACERNPYLKVWMMPKFIIA